MEDSDSTNVTFPNARTPCTFKFVPPQIGQVYKFYIRMVNSMTKTISHRESTSLKHCYKLFCKSADVVPVCQVVIARGVGRMAHDRCTPSHSPLHPFVLILCIFQSSAESANKLWLPFVFAKKTVNTPFNRTLPHFYITEADGVERRWNPFKAKFMSIDKVAY